MFEARRNAHVFGGSLLVLFAVLLLTEPFERVPGSDRFLRAPKNPRGVICRSLNSRLPVSFVENRGQWDARALFVASRGPIIAWLERHAITLGLAREARTGVAERTTVRLVFEGAAESVTIEGAERQGGAHHFLLGAEPDRWRTGVPGYGRVFYRGLWEGVDLASAKKPDCSSTTCSCSPGQTSHASACGAKGSSASRRLRTARS